MNCQPLTSQLNTDRSSKIDLIVANSRAKAFVLFQLLQEQPEPCLFLTPIEEEGRLLRQTLAALRKYLPREEPPLFLPDLLVSGLAADVRLAHLYRFLYDLLRGRRYLGFVGYEQFFQPLPAPEAVIEAVLELAPGRELDREDLLATLYEYGYSRQEMVSGPGEYACRGFIIDLFVPCYDLPVRMELDGDDTLVSLRSFDCLNQRTIEGVDEMLIVPLKPLFVLAGDAARQKLQALKVSSYQHRQALQDFARRLWDAEAEPTQYQTAARLLYSATLLDYHAEGMLVLDEKQDFSGYTPPPLDLTYLSEEVSQTVRDAADELKSRTLRQYRLSVNLVAESDETTHIRSSYVPSFHGQWNRFIETLNGYVNGGYSIAVFLPSHRLLENAKGMLQQAGFTCDVNQDWRKRGVVHLLKGRLTRGFRVDSFLHVFFCEKEILGHSFQPDKPKSRRPFLDSITKLKTGDYVVHRDHGVGRYLGIKTMDIKGKTIDFVALAYKNDDKLFIPVYNLSTISRYAPADKEVALDALSSQRFMQKREKIKERLLKYAAELLDFYARRSLKKGFSFKRYQDFEDAFDSSFLFEETDDQYRATEEIKQDMARPAPMDRLLVGDVGFGKTEVAMRAAFRAVLNGKQVAVLVPTTILAQQHYATFQDRFAQQAVSIAMMSRFTPAARTVSLLQEITEGKIDIVIGTHKLLSRDMAFKDLGLLIIDEEHRFGVRHKEALRYLKEDVDTLTLSATPIPRTLYMGVSGLRDISFIVTPPKNRLPVNTAIIEAKDTLIHKAITKELRRGGQIYFVHNRVKSIYDKAAWLREIVPNARLVVGHAQMKDSTLERVMLDFLERKYDILLCTTIIESGIDIPNVNTIFIDRADTLGLAQIYQLRGRVGRSDRKANAFLMVKSKRRLKGDAKLRLQAVMNLRELGSGFQLAEYDLDIRGAGNLLGKEQSGHIAELGFEYYSRMLRETVEEMKGNKVSLSKDVSIKLDVSAYIPPVYMPDASDRYMFYKKLATRRDVTDLDDVRAEMVDRFGPIPKEVEHVVAINRMRIRALRTGIKEIVSQGNTMVVTLYEQNRVDVKALLELVKRARRKFRLKESQIVLQLKDATMAGIEKEYNRLLSDIFIH